MADKRPVFAENFSANLTAIQMFLGPQGVAAFQRVLDQLFDEVIPMLCRFPLSGLSFLAHETKIYVKKLRESLERHDDIREFIVDDYLFLYLIRGNSLVFLSIEHHRQLSFDLKGFWPQRERSHPSR